MGDFNESLRYIVSLSIAFSKSNSTEQSHRDSSSSCHVHRRSENPIRLCHPSPRLRLKTFEQW